MNTKRSDRGDPAASPAETATSARAASAVKTSMRALPPADTPSAEDRIRVAAYFLARERGFAPGRELDDWLAAEAMLQAACEHSSTVSAEESPATDSPSQSATGLRRERPARRTEANEQSSAE